MNTSDKQAYDIPTFCLLYSIGRTRTYREIKEGRLQPLKIGRKNHHHQIGRRSLALIFRSEVMTGLNIVTTCLDSIMPESVDWLAKDLVAMGKVNILAGLPGTGKSLFTASLVSAVSTGSFWLPAKKNLPLMNILLIAHEDALGDTIVPRMMAMGGDLKKIHRLEFLQDTQGQETSFSLDQHLPTLRDKIVSDGIGLLIIDPITAYLGKKDSYKEAEVRALLTPLARLSEDLNIAILAIMHLNKSASTSAMKQLGGSMAFPGVARVTTLLAKDPSDARRRLLLSVKNNIGNDKAGWVFKIEDATVANGIETCKIEWLDEKITSTADEIIGAENNDTKWSALEEAKGFLLEALKNGPIESSVLLNEAILLGISDTTLKRAKLELCTRAERVDGAGDKGKWLTHPPEVQ